MIRESHLKAAVIDALFENDLVDEKSVIVSEMPLASWTRRADLVLANGKLVAFEIKSDADRTARLGAQVEAYWSVMEGVTVVTGPRHIEAALATMPSFVGLFIAENRSGSLRIQKVRKPHIRPLSVEGALKLMVLPDLRRLLKSAGDTTASTADRFSLEARACELPLMLLREAAREAVKRRYRSYYEEFMRLRGESGSLEALSGLRRAPWRSAHKSSPPERDGLVDESTTSIERMAITPRLVVSRTPPAHPLR